MDLLMVNRLIPLFIHTRFQAGHYRFIPLFPPKNKNCHETQLRFVAASIERFNCRYPFYCIQ